MAGRSRGTKFNTSASLRLPSLICSMFLKQSDKYCGPRNQIWGQTRIRTSLTFRSTQNPVYIYLYTYTQYWTMQLGARPSDPILSKTEIVPNCETLYLQIVQIPAASQAQQEPQSPWHPPSVHPGIRAELTKTKDKHLTKTPPQHKYSNDLKGQQLAYETHRLQPQFQPRTLAPGFRPPRP